MSGVDKSKPISPSGNVSFYTQADMVRQFHRAFQRAEGRISEQLPEKELDLRKNLVEEEWKEFCVAIEKVRIFQSMENKAELLDAIVDTCYVLMGTAVAFGLPFDVAFDMVHQANMAKLGPDGKPIVREDGKILKPEGWKKADLNGLLMLCFKHDTIVSEHQKVGLKDIPEPKTKALQ